MTERFLFLPVGDVIEMLGGPDGGAAGLIKWLADVQKVKTQMDRKTLQRAVKSESRTPQTAKKMKELEEGLCASAGTDIGALQRVARSSEDEWEMLVAGLAEGLPWDFLPEARALLRQRLAEDAALMREIRDEARSTPEVMRKLLHSPLAMRLNQEFNADTVVGDWEDWSTAAATIGVVQAHDGYKRWLWHCRISLVMEILARADVEFCVNEIPQGTLLPANFGGLVGPLLPTQNELPLRRLFERWRKLLKLRSWEQLAERGGVGLRTLRYWIDGEAVAPIDRMKVFLKELGAGDWERESTLAHYCVAVLLTRLWERVKRDLPRLGRKKCLLMFRTFLRHRERILSGQEGAPPCPNVIGTQAVLLAATRAI